MRRIDAYPVWPGYNKPIMRCGSIILSCGAYEGRDHGFVCALGDDEVEALPMDIYVAMANKAMPDDVAVGVWVPCGSYDLNYMRYHVFWTIRR